MANKPPLLATRTVGAGFKPAQRAGDARGGVGHANHPSLAIHALYLSCSRIAPANPAFNMSKRCVSPSYPRTRVSSALSVLH